MDRESRQIALVWAVIAGLVFIAFLGHSAVERSRYLRDGQAVNVEVTRRPGLFSGTYTLIETGVDSPAVYESIGRSLLVRHSLDGTLDVLVLPDYDYVQPVDHLEFWSSRLEVKLGLLLVVIGGIAALAGVFKAPPEEQPETLSENQYD